MASLAFRQMRPSGHLPALVPMLFPGKARQLITGSIIAENLPSSLDPEIRAKKPRRRWMSVTDLVTEVEQDLVKGVRLEVDGPAYANLMAETLRLRGDNDNLQEAIRKLKEDRAQHVGEEEKITAELRGLRGSSLLDIFQEAVRATQKIQNIDFEVAALRNQNKQNIVDVGALKLTKSRIENMANVTALVDRVEEEFKTSRWAIDGQDRLQSQDGHERLQNLEVDLTSLNAMIAKLQDEYDRVRPKIAAYGIARGTVASELDLLEKQVEEPGHTAQELDLIRYKIMRKLQQDQRMLAQLGRLRQLEVMNTDYVGKLDRTRKMLERLTVVRSLLAAGDAKQIKERLKVWNEDLATLREGIKSIEGKLDAHADEGKVILANLRILHNSFTPEAGKQREQLIANIHQEAQWNARLAVLRGEKMQKLRFIGLLQAALPK